MEILFDNLLPAYKSPPGAVKPGQPVRLRVDIPAQCSAVSVRFQAQELEAALARESVDGPYEHWTGTVTPTKPGACDYCFRIRDKNGEFTLLRRGRGTNMEAGERWLLTVTDPDFAPPQTSRGAVYYQIFPDRFAKSGDCDLSQKLTPYALRDFDGFTPAAKDASDFAGGNLRGIMEKLPYLEGLGVKALYLNPVFLAASNHRYDTADYLRLDPLLGTQADFSALCRALHQRDMKLILDGVFSHTGSDSLYFDAQKRFGGGAVSAGPSSPYYDWYDFQDFPEKYTCWWGVPCLPCVNELSPSYQAFIFDQVLPKWIGLGADGFRLDVADELPDEFIQKLRARLKALKPEAVLLGEVWEDAAQKVSYGVRRRYFTAQELDGVINYPLRTAILNFVSGKDGGEALAETVLRLAEHYPQAALDCTMSVLGTHDTERLAQTLPDRSDRRLAAFLQFTLPGSPVIYYGDEAGLGGGSDPMNRLCFPWGREDRALTEFYRQLSALKNENAPLKKGSVEVLQAGDGVFRFRRSLDGQAVECLADTGKQSFGFTKK